MGAPSYDTVLLGLADQIDTLTETFVAGGYQALSQTLAKPLALVCVLYIVLVGFGITRGLITTPLQAFITGVLRMGMIYKLAMDWAFFSSTVVAWFMKGMSELGEVMMQLLPRGIPSGQQGVNGGLQDVLTEVVRVGCLVWNAATVRHPGPVFCALMIYASGIAVVGLAFFELVVAKFMLSLCLSTAPLFILCTLFDKTRSFFDQWLGKIVGFSLVIFFVSTVVGFCMHLVHWSVGTYLTEQDSYLAVGWIPLFLCACLCVMALLEVVGMAKSIGGSCSTGTGSAMVGGFISGTLSTLSIGGLGKRAWSLGKNLNLKKREDPDNWTQQRSHNAMKAIQEAMRGQQKWE